MKKKNYAIISVMVLMAIALAGCGDSKAQAGEEFVLEDPIVVQLTLGVEQAFTGETILMEALVTQSGEPVEDADQVKFEIIREGGEAGVTIPVKHQGHGIYMLEKSFEEAGTYRIISHVTARGQHSMPAKEIIITAREGNG